MPFHVQVARLEADKLYEMSDDGSLAAIRDEILMLQVCIQSIWVVDRWS